MVNSSPFTEKRKYSRIKTSYPANLIIGADSQSTISLQGKAIDISEGGFCLDLDKQASLVDKNPILQANIKIYSHQIDSYAELVWNLCQYSQNHYRYGIKFVNLPDKHKEYLKKLSWLHEKFLNENLNNIMDLLDDHNYKVKERVNVLIKEDIQFIIQELMVIELQNIIGNIPLEQGKLLYRKFDLLAEKGDSIGHTVIWNKIMIEIKEKLRYFLNDWLYSSKIIKHALKKPYGHPGDYEIVEMIYDNKEISDDKGKYFDRYLLDNPYAVAIRNRKDLMKVMLKDTIKNRSNQPEIKILNIACGSCREIRELFQEKIIYNGKIKLTCLDFEDNALLFCRNHLKSIPEYVEVEYLKRDIKDIIRRPDDYYEKFQNMDLVYSIGLVDYLPNGILKKSINAYFQMLKTSGQLAIAFKDRNRSKTTPIHIDWYCDWRFVPRTKDMVIELIESCHLKDYSLKVIWESTGIIFYIIITKLLSQSVK